MKRQFIKLFAAISVFTLWSSTDSHAADKVIPGPKGGKVLNRKPPYTEFVVQPDHTVALNFYGVDMKPVAVMDQSAIVFADAKQGRAKLTLEKSQGTLVSKTPLPEGDGYNVMVQLKPTPTGKTESYKISFQSEKCAECKRAEYACICEGDHKDHDEKTK